VERILFQTLTPLSLMKYRHWSMCKSRILGGGQQQNLLMSKQFENICAGGPRIAGLYTEKKWCCKLCSRLFAINIWCMYFFFPFWFLERFWLGEIRILPSPFQHRCTAPWVRRFWCTSWYPTSLWSILILSSPLRPCSVVLHSTYLLDDVWK
jgi:hypothetical protein